MPDFQGGMTQRQGPDTLSRLATEQDVLTGTLIDRQSTIDAQQRQMANEQARLGNVRETLGRGVQDIRQVANELPDRAMAGSEEGLQRNQNELQEVQQVARQQEVEAQQRRQEALTEAKDRVGMTEDEFNDYSANAIQSSRKVTLSNVQDQQQQILAAAGQAGLDASDPQVQQQLRDVQTKGIQQLGSLANDAVAGYNTAMAQLRSSGSQLLASVRQGADSAVQQAGQASVGTLLNAAAAGEARDRAVRAERQANEHARAQLLVGADQ